MMTHGEVGTWCLGGSLLVLGYLLIRMHMLKKFRECYTLRIAPPDSTQNPNSLEAQRHYHNVKQLIIHRPPLRQSLLPRQTRREDLSSALGITPSALDLLRRGLDLVNEDRLDDGWLILQDFIGQLDNLPVSDHDRAEFLLGIAISLRLKEKFHWAEPLYGKVRSLLEVNGDARSLLRACIDQGFCQRSMARDDKALPAYQQAEQIATDLDDHEALFIIWNNLGMILLEIGRFEEAAHLFWISVKTRLQLGKMEEIHEVYRNASLAFKRIAHDRVGNSSEKRYIISAYWLAIMFAKLAYDDRTEEQLFAHFKAVQLEN